jgi:hypothetical protein
LAWRTRPKFVKCTTSMIAALKSVITSPYLNKKCGRTKRCHRVSLDQKQIPRPTGLAMTAFSADGVSFSCGR